MSECSFRPLTIIHVCVSLSADVYNGTGTNGWGRGTSDCYVERFVVLYEARLCFHFRYSACFCLFDVNRLERMDVWNRNLKTAQGWKFSDIWRNYSTELLDVFEPHCTLWLSRHCVRWGPTSPKRGTAPIFGPCLLWPNGRMDQAATWYMEV